MSTKFKPGDVIIENRDSGDAGVVVEIPPQHRGDEGDVESAVWAHWLERDGTWSTPMWLRENQVSPHPAPEEILLSLMKALTAGRVDND